LVHKKIAQLTSSPLPIALSQKQVLAYLWDYCSNERMSATKNLQKNPREIVKSIAQNHKVISSIKGLPWPLRPRQFIGVNVLMKQPDGSYISAWRPPMMDEFSDNRLTDIGSNKQRQLVRGETRGYSIIKKIPGKVDSCVANYVSQIDAKGNIPVQIMNKSIARSLGPIFQVHEKFSRDDEVDKMERLKLMDIMRSSYQDEVYDIDQTAMIDTARSRMTAVPNDSFRPLESPDFKTKMR